VYKDGDVEDTVDVEVLDAIVLSIPQKKLLADIAIPRSTNRVNIGISSGFFSIRYGSSVAVCHRSISFSRRKPLLTRMRRSSVFSFTFFHPFAGLGRGEEDGDDNDWSVSPASSQLLFFDTPVFVIFAGALSSSKSQVFSLAFAQGL
jgi:hypothetical protein